MNDRLGHSGSANELLLQLAHRLLACLPAREVVGGYGDEYAAASLGSAGARDVGLIFQRMVAELSRPIEIGGHSYQFSVAQMNTPAVERLQIENELRGALKRGEFQLYYQPKVNAASGEISGFEALLRWQHPVRGQISPAEFISILEDTGLIIPVGEWVVATVCEQLKQWQRAGLNPLPVAINLSPRQFAQGCLDTVIADILESTDVSPELLEFELTESMLMADPEAAVGTLKALKSFGIRLSVDDFGTGYSSLAYLKRFPLDALKIDRTFIRDVTADSDDAAIVLAIINLAHSLKLKVVAEGVEMDAQRRFLRKHACDEMQGFYFARPLPAAECAGLLMERGTAIRAL